MIVAMFTHALLFAFLATLGPNDKEDQPKGPKPVEDQHFCCTETWNEKGTKYGDDCDTIDKSDVKACRLGGGAILYCNGSWDQNTSGTVTCA
jgi:hypothetical protein